MPDVILTSRSFRFRGARGTRDTAFLGQAKHNPRSIQLFSGRLRLIPATTTPTARLVHGGESPSDTDPFPARLTSVKLQSRVATPNVTRRGGVISENQDDKRATTTVVMVTGPRVDAMQVTAQWREA